MIFNATLVIQAFVNGILIGSIYALVAIGLALIFGVMNIVNFAHGSLMMMAMYVSYWLFALLKIDPYLSMFATIPFLFFSGLLIQRFLIDYVLEAKHSIQILLTVGLSLFLDNLALFLFSPDFRAISVSYQTYSIVLRGIIINYPQMIAFFLATVLTFSLYIFLKKTIIGKAIRATAVEKEGAILVGINTRQIYYLTFALGSACVGAAGAAVLPFFYCSPNVGYAFIIPAFVVVVLGGMGNFWATFVSGLIIGVAENLGAIFVPGSLKQMVMFVIFILVLLFKPRGIFSK
jgi:branched-chain amino acid transport system permease protein